MRARPDPPELRSLVLLVLLRASQAQRVQPELPARLLLDRLAHKAPSVRRALLDPQEQHQPLPDRRVRRACPLLGLLVSAARLGLAVDPQGQRDRLDLPVDRWDRQGLLELEIQGRLEPQLRDRREPPERRGLLDLKDRSGLPAQLVRLV